MRVFIVFLLALAYFLGQQSALAQSNLGAIAGQKESQQTTVLPEQLTPEIVREIVSKLSDEQVRQLLIDRLDAVAAEDSDFAQKNDTSIARFLQRVAVGNYETIVDSVMRLPILLFSQGRSFQNFIDKLGTGSILNMLLVLLGALVAAFAAEWLVNQVVKRWLRLQVEPENQADGSTLGEVLQFLIFRLVNDLAGLVAFLIVTRVVLALLVPAQSHPYAWSFALYLIVLPRVMAAVSRFLFSPNNPRFRIVHTDDNAARYLHWHQISLVALIGFTIFIVEFNSFNDVPMGQSRLGFWLNLSIHLYIIYIVWRAWDGLTDMMRGASDELSPLEYRITGYYPNYAIVVSIGTWFLVNTLASFEQYALLQTGAHYKMMFVLLMVPAINTAIRGLVRQLVPPMKGEGVIAENAHQSTKRSYIRIGRVLVFVMSLFLIAGFWDISFNNLAAAGVGAKIAARLVAVLLILACGYLVWELVTLLINRKLAAEQTAAGVDLNSEEPGGGEGGGAGSSRLSTVLPIIRLTLQVVVVVITVLTALGNVGVDVTPLVAGAGIIGLAVGFGAQTLVRDVVSGIFFLIDDAFRVGEYVVIGDTVGTVEKISLRSLQLRHHEGAVHTIPYGEIPKVTNNSRDWVIMKLKFTFPFETDPNRIKKIFKQVGRDMLEADYADDLIQTFKSQGVYDVDDVGVIIRGKFMTKPGAQWIIRKDIYNRVQKALDEAGIQFARKEVRVQIPGLGEDTDLSSSQKKAIAAGASDAVEKMDVQPAKK